MVLQDHIVWDALKKNNVILPHNLEIMRDNNLFYYIWEMITSSLIYNKNNLLKQQQQNSETTILQYTTSKVNGVKDSFQKDSSWIAIIFFQ